MTAVGGIEAGGTKWVRAVGTGLHALVRAEVDALLAGYAATEIVPPALGPLSGVLGAIALALSARP